MSEDYSVTKNKLKIRKNENQLLREELQKLKDQRTNVKFVFQELQKKRKIQ